MSDVQQQIEPDADGMFRCKEPGCVYPPQEKAASLRMHALRMHPTPEQRTKWHEGVTAGNQARAAERLAGLTNGDTAQAPTGNVLEELAETEAARQAREKETERKRLDRAAKRQRKALDTDELFRRVGRSIDVLYPKITGEMVPELAELFRQLADRLTREHT